MEEYISITELLNRIKKQRKIVLELDHKYLDPDEFKKSKSLFSLYNPSRDITVNGIDIDKSKSDIIKQFESITSNIDILRHLLIIKEQVNSTFKLVVPDILLGDAKNTALSLAQILVLKSPLVKEHYLKFAERLKSDINNLQETLDVYNSNTLSDEKINAYVLAKLNSLKINLDYKSITNLCSLPEYDSFAKEYIDANKLEIIDPLNLQTKSAEYINNIYNFYDIIDLKLLEFNSSTKIWINIDNGTWRS